VITIVVADDQELVRAGFVTILGLQDDIDVVGEAANGAEAVDLVVKHQPDIALLDIRMPQLDGIQAAQRICAQTSTRVIMLTTFDHDEYIFDALQAGASGFLLKDVRRDDLVHAVRVVHKGQSLLAPSVARRLIDAVTKRAAKPASTARLGALTERERQTLVLLAKGLSNAEIAAELVVSDHTVKTHVSSILSKLHLRDRIQAVICAYESGLV
jgi:DNA-binding NarL/FixJ family response regulator